MTSEWWFWLLLLPLAAAALVARRRAFKKLMRRSGQREDGTWEKGRSPDDMTAVGKIATVIALVAFAGLGVMRVTDHGDGWMWAVGLSVLLACFAVVLISERRRVRREKVDVGYGPGRLKGDGPQA